MIVLEAILLLSGALLGFALIAGILALIIGLRLDDE